MTVIFAEEKCIMCIGGTDVIEDCELDASLYPPVPSNVATQNVPVMGDFPIKSSI